MHQVHAHVNKRTRKKPNTKLIIFFDRLVVVMGIINLFATMPQVYTIWHGQDASGVSTLSWGYYSVFSAVLLMYGLVHKAQPIIATYMGAVILYTAIFIGSIVY